LAIIIGAVEASAVIVPLSFTNIYETAKINDPVRREHLAHVQTVISRGRVFRGRRRVFAETLKYWLASHLSIELADLPPDWFLSDLWFEAAGDYSPDAYGYEISPNVLNYVKANPAFALFHYLTQNDDVVRKEAVRRFTFESETLLLAIETRRALVAGEKFSLRKRAYAARQIIDELNFILAVGRDLGQNWNNVSDLERNLVLRMSEEVPVLRIEREVAVRLEDQSRLLVENDLRDMSAIAAVLPLADIFIAEKPFVNLARQAGLGQRYKTTILTSVSELAQHL
jgi:hypothetical protein